MSLTTSNIEAKEAPSKRKMPLIWRILLVVFLCLILLLAVIWTQRYSLIEMSARKSLANEKIEADFSIRKLTPERAVIDNIRLSQKGAQFFSAKRVSLDYTWREAIKFKFDDIEVLRPVLDLEIDEAGNIINEWVPKGGEASGDIELPAKRVLVKNGRLNLKSPYADVSASVDADLTSLQSGTLQAKIDEAALNYGDFSGVFGGNIDAKIEPGKLGLNLDLTIPRVNRGDYFAKSIEFKGPAHLLLETGERAISSDVSVKFGEAGLPDIKIGSGKLLWKGLISEPQKANALPEVSGAWSADINNVSVSNAARRDRLANSLTMNEMIGSISSTAPFAAPLTKTAGEFMKGSDITAAGDIKLSELAQSIFLKENATIQNNTGAKDSFTLKASAEGSPLYHFDPDTKNINVMFDAELSGLWGLSAKNAKLLARSEAGQSLSNLQSFSADVKTHKTWRAKTAAGKPVRLAPIQAKVAYKTVGDARLVTASGAVGFDGDVPGGYVKGAKAVGNLSLRLLGETNSVNFYPARGSVIEISELETETDWMMTNLKFGLKPNTAPLYKRNKSDSRISTQVIGASGRLLNKITSSDMQFELDQANVTGVILNDKQSWTIKAENTHITSDVFPSPGTDVRAPVAELTAELRSDVPVRFSASSPSADIKTQLISAKKMNASAEGTPSDMRAKFSQGIVKFSAGELPVLPLAGTADFDGENWAGTAQTSLPRAEETPINIVFDFTDGVGSADIEFENLQFKPRGLQPKHLVSALAGKVSQVNGGVSSKIHLSFGADQPLKSSGTLTIKDMSVSTLPGPLSGMNSEMTFSSFFPLETDGPQTLKLGSFDPGFPLADGEISFEVIPDGIKLHQARWPMGSGFINLQPTVWLYSAPQNRVTLAVEKVQLGEFLKDIAGGKFTATGEVSGLLPVLIEGVKVHVENGLLSVKDGGVIQYHSPQTDAAGEANPYAGYAFDALKNFEYKELEAALNGPLDGNMKLSMKFDGANPKVLYGSQFRFNIGIEGELLNIMRSFQVGTTIKQQILDQIKSQQPVKADLETTPR